MGKRGSAARVGQFCMINPRRQFRSNSEEKAARHSHPRPDFGLLSKEELALIGPFKIRNLYNCVYSANKKVTLLSRINFAIGPGPCPAGTHAAPHCRDTVEGCLKAKSPAWDGAVGPLPGHRRSRPGWLGNRCLALELPFHSKSCALRFLSGQNS